jgi:hypothetical protein
MDWNSLWIQCTLKVKEAIVSLYEQSHQELQAISTPFGSPYKDPNLKRLYHDPNPLYHDSNPLYHDPSKIDP